MVIIWVAYLSQGVSEIAPEIHQSMFCFKAFMLCFKAFILDFTSISFSVESMVNMFLEDKSSDRLLKCGHRNQHLLRLVFKASFYSKSYPVGLLIAVFILTLQAQLLLLVLIAMSFY